MSEFDVDLELAPPPAPKQGRKKAAAPVAEGPAAPARGRDPEDDRANWPTIMIAHEDEKPNYEYIAVSGTKQDGQPFTHSLQVQRGVPVQVPPSVVHMLRETVQTHFHQTQDPITKRMQMHRIDRPPIPWQLLEKGPHIR